MNIKLKAASYTAAYIAGCFAVGGLFVAVDYFFGSITAILLFGTALISYLARTFYQMKVNELKYKGE